jgi:signal-transduction protein with cAMP-binding, CBS, and nucleotidyltransferase domain
MLPNASADAALMNMTRKRIGKVFVCDTEGVLMGLVSKTDILNVANERQHFQQEHRKSSSSIMQNSNAA